MLTKVHRSWGVEVVGGEERRVKPHVERYSRVAERGGLHTHERTGRTYVLLNRTVGIATGDAARAPPLPCKIVSS